MSEANTQGATTLAKDILVDIFADDYTGYMKDAVTALAKAEHVRFQNLVNIPVSYVASQGTNADVWLPSVQNFVRGEGRLLTEALDHLSVGKGILQFSVFDAVLASAAVYKDYRDGENWVSELVKQAVSFGAAGYLGSLATAGLVAAGAPVTVPVLAGALVATLTAAAVNFAWDGDEGGDYWQGLEKWTPQKLAQAETAIDGYALEFKEWAIEQRENVSANIDAATATISKWLDEKIKFVNDAAEYAKQHAGELGPEIVKFWDEARSAVQDAANAALDQLSEFADDAKQAGNELWNGLVDWTKGAFGEVKENLKDFDGDFLGLFGKSLGGLDSLGTNLANSIGNVLQHLDPRDLIASNFANLIDVVKGLFQDAEQARCPIVLDLDGDGIETLGHAADVHFDHDGNGFAELSGWVAPDDGLLVFDRSGNGKIDNGGELFGNYSVVGNGKAQNGFVALGQLDSNKDKSITAADKDFSKLKVWRDADSDGVVDAGELMTLTQAGVKSLSTSYVEGTTVDKNGNQHLQIGKYTTTDGKTREMTDVWFDVNTTKTVDKNTVSVSAEIAKLPDIVGTGNVSSLQQAMAKDSSGKLVEAVEKFLSMTDSGSDTSGLVIEIIYRWAGVYDIDPESRYTYNSRGANYLGDARKLEALEAFLGEDFTGQFGEMPNGPASQAIVSTFDKLASFVSTTLAMETRVGDYVDLIKLKWNDATTSMETDVSAVVASLTARYATDRQSALVDLGRLVATLKNANAFGEDVVAQLRSKGNPGSSGFSAILANVGLDGSTIGTDGADTVTGTDGADIVLGFGGSDGINAGDGNDRIIGGSGNDILSGNDGADTYVFSRGEGKDTIRNLDNDAVGTNKDTLEFGKGISASDIDVARDGFDVVLKIKGTSDEVRIADFLVKGGTDANAIEGIKFADGTVWNIQKIVGLVGGPSIFADYLVGIGSADTINALAGNDEVHGLGGNDNIDGGDGDDVVYGEAGNDTLEGGKGDDSLWGGDGNDTLVGGVGDDYLMGGIGSDTYSFAIGWGKDTINDNSFEKLGVTKKDIISFAEGIAPSDITVWRNETNDLVFSHANEKDQIVVAYEFLRNNNVDEVRFVDGTVWDVKKITSMVGGGSKYNDYLVGDASNATMNGREGNDTIVGGDGNETLVGGVGNDFLDGSEGSDIYKFDLGWGKDIISNAENGGFQDFIVFGSSVNAADVAVRQVGLDMVLDHRNGDTITVKAHYVGSSYQIDEVRFHDGTVWDVAELSQLPQLNKAPVITSNGGGAKASVNVAEGKTPVTTLKATDANVGATLKYAIVGGADSGKFVINATTGVLAFKSATDFEEPTDSGRNNIYDVVVRVTDNGGKSDEQAIAVTVTNINEAPVIANSGGAAAATIRIAENVSEVAVMQASDADKNALTWSLSGADAKLFAIDAKTGKLTFKEAPDYEAPKDADKNNSYQVTVEASDGKLADTQSLTITVTDVKGKVVNGTSSAEKLLGTAENDTINGKGGADTLTGGNGDDRIEGGVGADILTGGVGRDTFVFASAKDSTLAVSGRDTITDFDGKAGDRIDLSRIDAKLGMVGDQGFAFTGTAGFSKKSGELRYDKMAEQTVVYGDIDGDGKADFSIHFDDSIAMSKDFFIL
ncbi:cadherin domain-containing protein [Pararhizobium sp. BT-229]|uniref:calcium-binding protein n=1 Tax=Pararhizobium sp. BT-229 TaxID=2986923 RepID=UPI0021F7721B|nr:calcium-binding protein [Pararhizobium sp. BT-229]MCV9964825.1 cadherin domain-containing protein [Pararhizobium sp. BT-229]